MNSVLLATRVAVVKYVGHRVWDRYENAKGKVIDPGGSITVREEWIDKSSGERRHAIREFRIDAEHGDLRSIAELTSRDCGDEVGIVFGVFEGGSGRTWRNALRLANSDEIDQAASTVDPLAA